MADEPNELEVLRALVEAHAQPHPKTGGREPIMYGRPIGGSFLEHHALAKRPPGVDDALLEDMHEKGLISIDYRQHAWHITPTSFGRSVVEEDDRIRSRDLVADIEPLGEVLSLQAQAENPLAWPVVRPVLAALRTYWQKGGFSQHGIQLLALREALPDEKGQLFAATIRALVADEYLATAGVLGGLITDDEGRVSQLPSEVTITEKAHTILDGWPGAAPEELVENLLAVLAVAAADEPNPVRKRRLETLAETIREVGVSVTSEVIAKVLTGGVT
jgi:hypothetical protein